MDPRLHEDDSHPCTAAKDFRRNRYRTYEPSGSYKVGDRSNTGPVSVPRKVFLFVSLCSGAFRAWRCKKTGPVCSRSRDNATNLYALRRLLARCWHKVSA